MVAMGMGDEDRLDFLALDRGDERRQMRSSSGPGSTIATVPSPTI
jgi:hypothetical protein